jgi:hypothetical protein
MSGQKMPIVIYLSNSEIVMTLLFLLFIVKISKSSPSIPFPTPGIPLDPSNSKQIEQPLSYHSQMNFSAPLLILPNPSFSPFLH